MSAARQTARVTVAHAGINQRAQQAPLGSNPRPEAKRRSGTTVAQEAVVRTSAPQTSKNSIPIITCPLCGGHMTLALIEPEGSDNHDRMFFDCLCGFEYRLSDGGSEAR